MTESEANKIFISDIGAITPVGLNMKTTYSAVFAGINAYREVKYYDEDFNNIKMAVIPSALLEESLDESLIQDVVSSKIARQLMIASLAIKQIAPSIPDTEEIPLFLATAEKIDQTIPSLDLSFILNIKNQSGVKLNVADSRIFFTGRAGGIDAIDLAIAYLKKSTSDYIIVGGVDTHFDISTVNYLLDNDRLLTENAMNGFIPGEGATFLLLSRKHSSNSQKKIQPYLLAPGIDFEVGHLLCDKHYQGNGLSNAASKALSRLNGSKISKIYSTMNGENYFAKEHGVMFIRNHESFIENISTEHPADSFGDLGAAMCTTMIGLAYYSMMKNSHKAQYLIYCSSDGGYRGAVVIAS